MSLTTLTQSLTGRPEHYFCPITGRNACCAAAGGHHCRVPESELVSRVAQSTGLTPAEAGRVIADVVAYFGETTESYVRRRHARLQDHGMRNQQIFAQLQTELGNRVVAPPMLSERQLRRIVYG